MTRHQARTLIVLLAAGCFGLGMVCMHHVAPPAHAEVEPAAADPTTADYGDTASDFVIPYDGFLMLDSTPLSGGLTLEFRLYEEDNGTLATTAEWTEQQTVTGYNGRFSVGLGSVTRINEDLLDAERLYLEIAIVNADGSTTTLGGVQAIEPVPYAIWSAHAANLSVAGNATVGGTLNTGGNATLGDAAADAHTVNGALTANHTLTVNGSTTLGNDTADTTTTKGWLVVGDDSTANIGLTVTGAPLWLGTSNDQGHGDGGRALLQQASDTLVVNYNDEFSGGVRVDSDVTTAGKLTVGNDASTNTNLEVTGTTLYLGTSNNQGQGSGGRALDITTSGGGTDGFLYVNRAGDFPGIRLGGDLVEVNGDMVIDGDDIDADDSQVLRLNASAGRPIQLAVHSSSSSVPNVGSDNGADAHVSGDGASIAGTTCNMSNRGAMIVSVIDEGNWDGLCYCAMLDNDRDGVDDSNDEFRWVCLNP